MELMMIVVELEFYLLVITLDMCGCCLYEF